MHLCPNFFLFPLVVFFNELFFELVETTKQLYDLPALIKCHFTTTSFDLWVSKVGHHINFCSKRLATKTHYVWSF
jgi:hypothetical protein